MVMLGPGMLKAVWASLRVGAHSVHWCIQAEKPQWLAALNALHITHTQHCIKTFATHQVNSSQKYSARVFGHAHWRNNRCTDDEWQFSFCLSGLRSVISWMVQQCVFTEWKMWYGLSRETSCTRRDLSISGQSLQARCPTHGQEQ